ncbi:PD-(D/E)XK nuclease-like domain-containing protein [Melissococcus plutonius]|nr:PD-(D/E)XK nuclease-like domain-containing protein [Melissococcus plutonius]KMT33298.1 PD-(D/E)XK nuclease superfamily protein [Melissococcus plutonius]KMT33644.1 PD-(D/E)XK nuclease superfamily protein [Melissococcus plutonius]KMT38993.1 PD-(D/E)XK nuclease superfamily protein [Melissococcus plutonius]MBB5177533.1 hypothetical protein [Melissococcus plutonius]
MNQQNLNQQLNRSNYYSREMNQRYMSVSQYKAFRKCEAATLAELNGDWQDPKDQTALLVGNYVHSFFESPAAHQEFKEENKQSMYSQKKPYGLLKSFQVAENMIQSLERQEAFTMLYTGEKEHITTDTLYGVEWKARIDCLNSKGGYFIDIKTTADMSKKVWNNRYNQRVSWIVDYGYYLQLAVYKQLLEKEFKKEFIPYITAVSKQEPPMVKFYELDPYLMESELLDLKNNIDRV